MHTKGTYCLLIQNHRDQVIKIGALGNIFFKKGYYVYVGSALNGLAPRLRRHEKVSSGNHDVTHWHIDYFLREQEVTLDTIYVIESEEPLECKIAEQVAKHGTPVPGFGCSDCQCVSHLYRVEERGFIEKMGLKKGVKGSRLHP